LVSDGGSVASAHKLQIIEIIFAGECAGEPQYGAVYAARLWLAVSLFGVIPAVLFAEVIFISGYASLFRRFRRIATCQQLGRGWYLIRPWDAFLEANTKDETVDCLTKTEAVSCLTVSIDGIGIIHATQNSE
jgi:hypothetical protein